MGEAAAVVGIVCGSRGSWLWSRPEANRRQADLDERQRGEFFDVLVQQADEARTRVREGSTWQGMPLLGASPSLGLISFVGPDILRSASNAQVRSTPETTIFGSYVL